MKSVKMGIFLILLLLTVMVMIPAVNGEEKNITINITAPE